MSQTTARRRSRVLNVNEPGAQEPLKQLPLFFLLSHPWLPFLLDHMPVTTRSK